MSEVCEYTALAYYPKVGSAENINVGFLMADSKNRIFKFRLIKDFRRVKLFDPELTWHFSKTA